MPLTTGTKIADRYVVFEVLGQGAMSTVYLVESFGTTLALKAFDPRGGTDAEIAESRQLFEQEIELLRRLDHPCIPKIHEEFTDNGTRYFAMDYIDGRTLESIVDKNGPAPESYVLPIAIQLVKLLAWLHTHPDGPIVFRDVKPSNVMVDYEGRVHLIDFGVARLWKPGQVKDTFPMGTPGFAAPEQYGRAQSGPSTDLYAWAATIHRTLTAVDPDPTTHARPLLRTVVPNASEEMELILDRCLRPDPKQRYQTARDVVDALNTLRETKYPHIEIPPLPVDSTAQPPTPTKSPSSVLLTLGVGCVTTFIIAFLLVPSFIRPHHTGGQVTVCKSNLKNIGTALEMYSTDNKGRFPTTLSQLTPTYLKSIPSCPTVGSVTYTGSGFTSVSNPDNYTVLCNGNNHAGVGYSPNYPQYTSTQGLLER